MADPWHHSLSSVKKWGGRPEDYLAVHRWFDASKSSFSDPRHRALRHHAEGIAWAIEHFGQTITIVTDRCAECYAQRRYDANPCHHCQKTVLCVTKEIPTRWVGEQHVLEDFGRIPCAADFLRSMTVEAWMVKGARKLSVELEREEHRETSHA